MAQILGIDLADIERGIQLRSLYELSRSRPDLTAGLDPSMLSAGTGASAQADAAQASTNPAAPAGILDQLTASPVIILGLVVVVVLLVRR